MKKHRAKDLCLRFVGIETTPAYSHAPALDKGREVSKHVLSYSLTDGMKFINIIVDFCPIFP